MWTYPLVRGSSRNKRSFDRRGRRAINFKVDASRYACVRCDATSFRDWETSRSRLRSSRLSSTVHNAPKFARPLIHSVPGSAESRCCVLRPLAGASVGRKSTAPSAALRTRYPPYRDRHRCPGIWATPARMRWRNALRFSALPAATTQGIWRGADRWRRVNRGACRRAIRPALAFALAF
jgi:hypothetical protein